MPTVTPSEGGYQYYQRSINDLEEDLRKDHKRATERQDDRIKHIEEANARDLAKKDEENEKTVQHVKEDSQTTIARNREQNKSELDKMKAQSYDKFGRYKGLEADTLKQELDSTTRGMEQQHQNDQRALATTEDVYHSRIEELNKEHQADLETKTQAAHDSAEEAYSSITKDQKQSYDSDQKMLKERYAELYRRAMDDGAFERRRAEFSGNEVKRDYDHRIGKLQESQNHQSDGLLQDANDRQVRTTEQLKGSHSEESRQLRDQVKGLLEAEKTYVKEKGQGTKDAVNDYENEWRGRQQAMSHSYDMEIEALKKKSKEADSYFAQLNNRTLKEKDSYYAGEIAKQNRESLSNQKDLAETFKHEQVQTLKRMNKDHETADNYLEVRIKDEHENREAALKEQAKAYQDTLERQRRNDRSEIGLLQKALVKTRTSDDASDISPAAEASVRKSMIAEYQKTANAEMERNQRSLDSVQQSYADRLVDTGNEKDAYITKLQQTSEGERQREKSELLNNLQEAETMKNTTLKNQELDHGRETEKLTKHYTSAMNEQRRQSEEIINNFQNESQNKLQAQRLESDFQSKMSQRTSSARQSELIRDYEKKLADQKADHDNLIHETKATADQFVRDNDRRNKLAMEEQARSYEQKLAEVEYQHKEHERYMTQNYQEDLEKMKRSNALLLQKKS